MATKKRQPPLTGVALTMKRAELRTAWDALQRRLDAVRRGILETDRELPAWCFGVSAADARRAAAKVYGDLLHTAYGTLGNEVTHLPGLLAASGRTVAAVAAYNEAKLAFMEVLNDAPAGQRRTLLALIRVRRAHRKQLRRLIHVLDPMTASIGWAWTKKVGCYEDVSHDQVGKMLSRIGDKPRPIGPQARADKAKLAKLPAQVKLTRVTPGAVYLVTNASYWTPNGHYRRRTLFSAMPVIYPGRELPEYRPLREGAPLAKDWVSQRRRRSNTKLDASPLFPSVNVYRRRRQ